MDALQQKNHISCVGTPTIFLLKFLQASDENDELSPQEMDFIQQFV